MLTPDYIVKVYIVRITLDYVNPDRIKSGNINLRRGVKSDSINPDNIKLPGCKRGVKLSRIACED